MYRRPKTRWDRLFIEVCRLEHALRVPKCAAIGLIELLRHSCHENFPDGDLSRSTDHRIAADCCWTRNPFRLVQSFCDAGILLRHPERGLVVARWREWCGPNTHWKLARRRLKFWDGSRPTGRARLAPALRREVLAAGVCAYCGTTESITVDHIRPICAGGTDDRSNLQPLCRPCNTQKGARLF